MAVNGASLASLIQTKMDTKFKQVQNYAGPLAQQNPSYFISMCNAIGNGVIQGNPVINFVTVDNGLSGSPAVAGVGAGVGVIVDTAWFTKELYKEIRLQSTIRYGSTSHPEWSDPNNQSNPYSFMTAMCEAISESVTEHYAQFRILQSVHPTIYSGAGVIQNGGFIGVSPTAVASAIQGLGTNLLGSFWPILCQAIGKVYSQTIMLHSTGTVAITGVCSSSQSQVCGIPSTGSGTGTAS